MTFNPVPNDWVDWAVGGAFVVGGYALALRTHPALAVGVPDALLFATGVGISNFVQGDGVYLSAKNPRPACPYDYDLLIG